MVKKIRFQAIWMYHEVGCINRGWPGLNDLNQ